MRQKDIKKSFVLLSAQQQSNNNNKSRWSPSPEGKATESELYVRVFSDVLFESVWGTLFLTITLIAAAFLRLSLVLRPFCEANSQQQNGIGNCSQRAEKLYQHYQQADSNSSFFTT